MLPKRNFQTLLNILLFPFAILSRFLPKKDIIIFSSKHGMDITDNSKYKFINEYKPNFYYLVKSKKVLSTPIFDHIYPLYTYSIKGILLQLLAKTAYYTHSIYDFIPCLVYGAKIINLWHGIPVKMIGPKADDINCSKIKLLAKDLLYQLFPYIYYMHCNVVVCPDKQLIQEYKEYYSISKPLITLGEQERTKYAIRLKKEDYILYAPTYRKYSSFIQTLDTVDIFNSSVVEYFKYIEHKLIIRPHPVDIDENRLPALPSIYDYDFSTDIFKTLSKYKIVITDYSGIYYDAKEMGIPCLLLSHDIDKYEKNVGLPKSYYLLSETTKNKTFIDLIDQISNLLSIDYLRMNQ